MRVTTTTVSVVATAATLALLGAGCRAAAPQPSATIPPTEGPTAAAPSPSENLLVAPAPAAPPPPDAAAPLAPPTISAAVPATPAPGSRVIRMIAKQWEWIPKEVRVRKGERVILEITNADVPHGFSIPDLSVNELLPPGRTTRVEFTPTTAGRFTFSCSVICGLGHRDMRGVLVVE